MDKLKVRGLRVITIIGCLPHERELPQPVEIDLTLECELFDCGISDDLKETADYATLVERVTAMVQASRDHLIERLAHRIAQLTLELPRVSAVTVTVKKPHAPIPHPLDHVAVEIRRTAFDRPPREPPLSRAIVAIGSNLGDRLQHLHFALRELSPLFAVSSIFETAPVGGPQNQGPFLNMVAIVNTDLDPFAFLRKCQRIEAAAGRVRTEHWGARTLDLDLLFYDDVTIRSAQLVIPHPRYAERDFVLAPLQEVAPERCPQAGATRLSESVIRYAAAPALDLGCLT